jgi:hypothetical protein
VGAAGSTSVLVLPSELHHRLQIGASFEVAGCRGYVLGARSNWSGERAVAG